MLKGKTAIITGAGRGIGRAIARRLSAAGANVVIAARSESQLDETRRAILRAGAECLAVRADVSQTGDVDRLVDEAARTFGRIDVLVNNAGIAHHGDIEKLEPDEFDTLLAVNVRSVYLCCRAVWTRMADAGGGTIINISSIAASDPFPGFAAYGGTKAFVETFSRALANEGRPKNIRVYCIAPGAVDTQMLRGPFPDFPADQTLDSDDVAALVEMLLGPGAEHIAGQTIAIRKA